MRFDQILAGVAWLVLSEQRVSYRRLKREFNLDDQALDDVRHELIQIKRCAVDLDGEFLVWAGSAVNAHTNDQAVAIAPLVTQQPSDNSVAAQHRQLTVMFCDLVGSTDLSGHLDPESLREVVRAYQESAALVIHRYAGHIAQYLGDGLLVYFGYPTAQGDDAQRAVHSALGIVDGLVALNKTLQSDHGTQLAVRIGIHTGPVVIGEMGGDGRHEQLALGETPNLAARLEGVAQPNGIVIGPLTKALCGNVFHYDDLGAHELKGVASRVQLWGIAGVRVDSNQADYTGETPIGEKTALLVGRDEETGLLRRAWESVKTEGRGHIVMISGEAGIGKSTLINLLRSDVRRDGLAWINIRCSPYHTTSSLHPIIEHYKRLAGWQPEDDGPTRLAKLEAIVEPSGLPLSEAVPLLASLLSLSLLPGKYPSLTLNPQQHKQQVSDMIIAMTLADAERQPLLAVWEDLHWADPSTLDLLTRLIEQVPTASLLVTLTSRPEFVPPWPARTHITPLTLNRLERPHAIALINQIVGAKPLPTEVVEHIANKADGVPLYVEELTKTIMSSQLVRDAGNRLELTGPLSSLTIPDSLHESLMARLDRLPKVRELAQLGSVLGREFAYEMISGLATSGETVLQQGLEQLVGAELLYQRGRPPRAMYFFKHALVRDAAYGSLLRRTREKVHQQAAELLERLAPDSVDSNPEVLAHHYTEAGLADLACKYWRKAGQRASQRFAHRESISHYRHALTALSQMEQTPANAELALHSQITIGFSLSWTAGSAADESGIAYAAARKLCTRVNNHKLLARTLLGSIGYHSLRAEWAESEPFANQLLALAQKTNDPTDYLPAYVSLGQICLWQGQMESAKTHLDKGLALDAQLSTMTGKTTTSPWARVSLYAYASFAAFLLGFPDKATSYSEKSIAVSDSLGHPFSRVYGLHYAAHLRLFMGDATQALTLATTEIELATEQEFSAFASGGQLYRGLAQAMLKTGNTGLDTALAGLTGWRSSQALTAVPMYLAWYADALGRSGQDERARPLMAEAIALAASTGEGIHDAEIHRLLGEQFARTNTETAREEAAVYFDRALAIARQQGARMWELRAATGLARLRQKQGRTSEASDLLEPVLAAFTEGFETVHLQEAKALLDGLA